MNKMVVAVFENEATAHKGLTALKSMHNNGEISMYASAVVSKDDNGKMRINTAEDNGPVGTATGLVTGSLIGLLGGPVGVAIGAAAGSFVGLLFDGDHESVNYEFVDEVSRAMTNGKTAVIAEIDEDWTIPIDAGLEPYNAIVFRRYRYEVVDQQLDRESKAVAAELKTMKEELKHASDDEKQKINAAIKRLQDKAHATNEALKNRIHDTQVELNGKVNAMQDQIKSASERREVKLKKRLATMKEEYNTRTAKLGQASALINEALRFKPEVRETESVPA